MKICFIIPLQIASLGCRFLSSYLRSNGHKTRLLFIPDLVPTQTNILHGRSAKFGCSDRLKHMILELVDGYDIIGFSMLVGFYEPLADLSTFLREKLNKPVVWGGIHATMSPESCLKHADIVCIGDGEETLLDIARTVNNDGELEKIPGIMFLKNGQTIKTAFRQPEHNLDRYPPPDFSFKEHFALHAMPRKEKMVKITPQNYRQLQEKYPDFKGRLRFIPYKTIFSRNCPYACSYCSIGSQDKRRHPYRTRGIESVIDELQDVITSYGDIIDVISFSDDTFFSHSEKWIEKFCETYKDRIKYPFRVIGHPLNINRSKVNALSKSGCMHIGMGIENLCKRILYDIYNRKTPVQKIIDSANILVDISKKSKMLPPTFDVILGNPYETLTDSLESFRSLAKIGQGAEYSKFHLCFFPGSKLFSKAVKDGIIKADDPVHYRSWYGDESAVGDAGLKILYKLINVKSIPRRFLQILSTPPIYRFINFLFGKSQVSYKVLVLAGRSLKRIRR